MTVREVVLKSAAKDDIRSHFRYIATDNLTAADKFEVAFFDAVERIQTFPLAGAKVRGYRGLRFTRVSSRFRRYLIIYRVGSSQVRIVRVLHGAMNIGRELSDSDLT